ncbi:hypothetical protein PUN28_002864 [Cardiocondyla obscurior]|uniref:Uncharacterized protein n=1 Tax=Cardiocondyla obscurior TaxID=286306 RepID=A0AAW2GWC4_9HYME
MQAVEFIRYLGGSRFRAELKKYIRALYGSDRKIGARAAPGRQKRKSRRVRKRDRSTVICNVSGMTRREQLNGSLHRGSLFSSLYIEHPAPPPPPFHDPFRNSQRRPLLWTRHDDRCRRTPFAFCTCAARNFHGAFFFFTIHERCVTAFYDHACTRERAVRQHARFLSKKCPRQ